MNRIRTAETIASHGKYLLSYLSSWDKKSIDDPILYSIDISDHDIFIDCLGQYMDLDIPRSIHLQRYTDELGKLGIGTFYTADDGERILVIETAVEVVLVYYKGDETIAIKVGIFRKCTID